ncbi:hypothetical protein NX059_012082 [Plenodomus lindquistii]|nr:hypothetical protein NX059_012082 [Plenodomus lindquistii]
MSIEPTEHPHAWGGIDSKNAYQTLKPMVPDPKPRNTSVGLPSVTTLAISGPWRSDKNREPGDAQARDGG